MDSGFEVHWGGIFETRLFYENFCQHEYDRYRTPPLSKRGADEGLFSEKPPKDTLLSEEKVGIRTYPNPASDVLWIDMDVPEEGIAEVRLYDALGKLVYAGGTALDGKNKVVPIPLQSLPVKGGLYLLQVQTPLHRYQEKIICHPKK